MENNDICSVATMARISKIELHECAYCRCRVSHPIGTLDPNGGRYCHLGWYYCGRCWEMWQQWWDCWCSTVSKWIREGNRQVNIFRFSAQVCTCIYIYIYIYNVCVLTISAAWVCFVFRSCLVYRGCCHSGWVWCVGPSEGNSDSSNSGEHRPQSPQMVDKSTMTSHSCFEWRPIQWCQASIGCLSDMGASLLYIVLHARLWLSERVCLNIVGVLSGWMALKAWAPTSFQTATFATVAIPCRIPPPYALIVLYSRLNMWLSYAVGCLASLGGIHVHFALRADSRHTQSANETEGMFFHTCHNPLLMLWLSYIVG